MKFSELKIGDFFVSRQDFASKRNAVGLFLKVGEKQAVNLYLKLSFEKDPDFDVVEILLR